MLNIREASEEDVSVHLYNIIHHYVALDREIKKFNGKSSSKGSSLDRYSKTREKLQEDLNIEQCKVEPLTVKEVVTYQVFYKGKEYLIDEDFAYNAQRIVERLVIEYS